MNQALATALDALGIPHKPRFAIEEVAEILGITRDQVVNLLKKGKLTGMKSSVRRWRGVYSVDLSDYLEKVNAPRKSAAKTIAASLGPAPQKAEGIPDSAESLGDLNSPAFLFLPDPVLSPDAGLSLSFPSPTAPFKSGRRELDI